MIVMKDKYRFAVIGGDKRQAVIARELLMRGDSVSCFALGEIGFSLTGCENCASLDKVMSEADVVLLPLPASRDGIYLNSQSDKVTLSEISRLAQKNKSLMLGNLKLKCQ